MGKPVTSQPPPEPPPQSLKRGAHIFRRVTNTPPFDAFGGPGSRAQRMPLQAALLGPRRVCLRSWVRLAARARALANGGGAAVASVTKPVAGIGTLAGGQAAAVLQRLHEIGAYLVQVAICQVHSSHPRNKHHAGVCAEFTYSSGGRQHPRRSTGQKHLPRRLR